MQMIQEARKLAVVAGMGVLAGLVVLAAIFGTAGPGMAVVARPLPCPTITPPPATRSPCPGTIWYSTYLGGSGNETHPFSWYDIFEGIALDAAGNVYVTGRTDSTDFPTTPGAYDTRYNGGPYDVFVAKFNNGGGLVYSTYLGGSGGESPGGIAVDSAGNAYIAGWADSAYFPTTPGAFDTTYNGGTDAFVTKLNAEGSALSYSTYLGAKSSAEKAHQVAVDAAGNAYVTGYTEGGLPTTLGAYDTTYNGAGDAFITKLNSEGSALVYSTFLGGKGVDYGNGIEIDSSGNAYIVGRTSGVWCGKLKSYCNDFPTTRGAFDTTYNGNQDAFVTKLNAKGSALIYSTYLGGATGFSGTPSWDEAYDVTVDTSGNAFLTGRTWSTDFPTTPNAFDQTHNGAGDAFVTELNPVGSALVYSTYLGGQSEDIARGIALDSSGQAHVGGQTGSVDFPTTSDAFDPTTNGEADAFLTKFNPDGSAIAYSTIFGGSRSDVALGLAMDPSGDAWITGGTESSDFPCTEDAYDPTYNGWFDGFVTRIER